MRQSHDCAVLFSFWPKISKSQSGLSCPNRSFRTNQSFNDVCCFTIHLFKQTKKAQNSAACNESPCTDLHCWKILVLKFMKWMWPADSSSLLIDLCPFQLLCTSRRLNKINLAAKLGWNAFSFSSNAVFLFPPGAFWLTTKVWRTRPRLGAQEKPVGRMRLDGPLTNIRVRTRWDGGDFTGVQRVSDAHASTETQLGAICFDLRLIIWQRGDGMLSIQPLVTPLTAFWFHIPPSFPTVWRSLALDGWSMSLRRPIGSQVEL